MVIPASPAGGSGEKLVVIPPGWRRGIGHPWPEPEGGPGPFGQKVSEQASLTGR